MTPVRVGKSGAILQRQDPPIRINWPPDCLWVSEVELSEGGTLLPSGRPPKVIWEGLQWDIDRRHFGPSCRSEEPTSEIQSLMRNSYAVFCLYKNRQS